MKFKLINETIMDNLFDLFNKKLSYKVCDGYYEIQMSLDGFLSFLNKNGWTVVGRGNGNHEPERYVIVTNENYKNQLVGILKIDNNNIQVGEAGGFD